MFDRLNKALSVYSFPIVCCIKQLAEVRETKDKQIVLDEDKDKC